MKHKHTFQFRPWHFILAIVLFFTVTHILVDVQVKHAPKAESKASTLTELDEMVFNEDGIRLIFFYKKNSELCDMMRYNLEQLAARNWVNVTISAMDVEKHPEYFSMYNISGIPNIVIFKGDKEINRIMGVVTPDNLERIIKKITKSNV